jgi:AraC-like DNA-binding protein
MLRPASDAYGRLPTLFWKGTSWRPRAEKPKGTLDGLDRARHIQAVRSKSQPTYAQQMVKPFWTVLRRYPQFSSAMLDQAEAAPEDARVPVALGQRFLQNAVELTGEEDLGLLAARETKPGSFQVLEFAALSAPTWRAAVETAFRYSHLMNEAADFRIEVDGGMACLVLHSKVPLTRAGIDFQTAAFHVAAMRWVEPAPELEVWFTYPEPKDIRQHRVTFGAARLRFGSPWNGFLYDAKRLETKLASADPSLHLVLREHAERLLAELAPGDTLVEQVRAQVLSTLKEGPLAASDVAAKMGVTRRTLTRRLRQQGTSFTQLLEDVRGQAAVHYLTATDHTVEDIAFLLGFSESSAFVRAFKRWHGVAPMAYRRSLRSS